MKKIVLKENETIKITVISKETGWFNRLFGFRKREPVEGFSVVDFKVKRTVLNCLRDNTKGYYSFEIANEIEIINNKQSIMKHFKKEVTEIINGAKCPFPLKVIPNDMGINLVSVESIEWDELDDGQIDKLTINFTPEVKG